MVESAKTNAEIIKRYLPITGIPSSKASSVSFTPSFSEFCQTPVSKMANAVSEQTTTVSMKGPNMAIKPSRIGSLVLD